MTIADRPRSSGAPFFLNPTLLLGIKIKVYFYSGFFRLVGPLRRDHAGLESVTLFSPQFQPRLVSYGRMLNNWSSPLLPMIPQNKPTKLATLKPQKIRNTWIIPHPPHYHVTHTDNNPTIEKHDWHLTIKNYHTLITIKGQ